MSLIYGYSNKYEKLLISCEENSDIAIKKANSASYRARMASEQVSKQSKQAKQSKWNEQSKQASEAEQCNEVKTFSGEIEFTRYGEPKTVRPFRTGIVLLGISTKGDTNNGDSVFYDFYDITGSKHISSIQGKSGYKILEKSSDIPHTQDTHTSLIPCSIVASLKGKNALVNKPNKSVKLSITIQYLELSGGISELGK